MAKLTEKDCLRIIGSGEADALDLIREHMPTAERRFHSLDRTLCKLLADVRQVFPDAQYYTAGGGFNLILGDPHDNKERGQQQLVALSGLSRIGDGDF